MDLDPLWKLYLLSGLYAAEVFQNNQFVYPAVYQRIIKCLMLIFLSFYADTDECEEPGQCGQGTCENLPGGFACDCQEGYSTTPDGRNCIGWWMVAFRREENFFKMLKHFSKNFDVEIFSLLGDGYKSKVWVKNLSKIV